MFMKIAELPAELQAVLKSEVRYGRADIRVEAQTETSIASWAGDGYRGFAIVADLATGRSEVLWGSWGGANPNEKTRVDLDRSTYPVPVNGCVVTGVIGGGKPTWATMVVHPDNLPKALTSGPVLDADDREVLGVFDGLRSSARKEALDRLASPAKWGGRELRDIPARIERLVGLGLLKRNRAGALSITTEGKNAL